MMAKEPQSPQPPSEPPAGGEAKPPPFDPDPRLIGQLERGRKPDADRFRAPKEKGK
jgi:hypothetical protein